MRRLAGTDLELEGAQRVRAPCVEHDAVDEAVARRVDGVHHHHPVRAGGTRRRSSIARRWTHARGRHGRRDAPHVQRGRAVIGRHSHSHGGAHRCHVVLDPIGGAFQAARHPLKSARHVLQREAVRPLLARRRAEQRDHRRVGVLEARQHRGREGRHYWRLRLWVGTGRRCLLELNLLQLDPRALQLLGSLRADVCRLRADVCRL